MGSGCLLVIRTDTMPGSGEMLTAELSAEALASLTAAVVPVATYFEDSDCVEFVKEDTVAIHRRIDPILTLIFDDTRQRLIGFKIKGFKYIYNEVLKPISALQGVEFVDLVPAIEHVFTKIGKEVFAADDDRKRAYQAAYRLAREANVKVEVANAA
jgi:hypothetical protein